jgi:hypothetical protein
VCAKFVPSSNYHQEEEALKPIYRGYAPKVHDLDDSVGPWGQHRPILQQDDDRISPRDRVLLV